MPKTALKTSSVDIVNAVRESLKDSPNSYQNRVPEATRFNLKQIGRILYDNDKLANEFLGNLINRISFALIKNKSYKNSLRELKKGSLEFGVTIEEIFVQIAKAHHFNPAIAEKKVFARELPDVKSAFHTLNRQDFYKVTISNDDLYSAFLSENGVTDMIAKIVESLYSGDNYDEYLLMRQLIINYIDDNDIYSVHSDPIIDSESAKSFLVKVRGFGRSLTFMSDQYNAMGVLTHSDVEDIIVFMTPETQAMIDVEALAVFFNIDKGDIKQRIIVVDSFGDSEAGKSTLAVITDKDFLMIYDKLFKFTEIYNGEGLYWNYFLHHWQLMSTSKFSPVIRITTDPVAKADLTSITLSADRLNVHPGEFVVITPKFEGTGYYTKGLKWSVNSSLSNISSQGVLQINSDENLTTLTVTVTSEFDPKITAQIEITVDPLQGDVSE